MDFLYDLGVSTQREFVVRTVLDEDEIIFEEVVATHYLSYLGQLFFFNQSLQDPDVLSMSEYTTKKRVVDGETVAECVLKLQHTMKRLAKDRKSTPEEIMGSAVSKDNKEVCGRVITLGLHPVMLNILNILPW